MPPNTPPTGGAPEAKTGEEPQAPPATPPKAPAATDGEETVTLSKKDHDELIRQRDQAFEKGRKAAAEAPKEGDPETQTAVFALMQKDAIRDAMAEPGFADEYPDVTMKDLLQANPASDEEIVEAATTIQARAEEIKQKYLKGVQVADAPKISQKEKDAQLQDLRKPAKSSRFQQALNLVRTQTK